MKNYFSSTTDSAIMNFITLLVFLLLGLSIPAYSDKAPNKVSGLKAGFSKLCITPPDGTRMMGWEDRDMTHGSEGVHDDLYVRALWIENDKEKVLILSYDICYFTRDLVDRIKGAIGRKVDLLPKQILINTSHTHDGPSTGTYGYAALVLPDRVYLDSLENATIIASLKAKSLACSVSLSTGAVDCPISLNRRKVDSSGKSHLRSNPSGTVYNEVPVCLFKDSNNKPVCLLFSASCHPTTIYGFQISADYPGAAMQKLDAYLGKDCSMFLQGVGGDTKVKSFSKEGEFGRTWEDVDAASNIIANNVIELIKRGLKPAITALKTNQVDMNCPMQPIPDKSKFEEIYNRSGNGSMNRLWAKEMLSRLNRTGSLPTFINIGIHMVQSGEDVRLVGLEGEAVADLGFLIKDYFKNGVTFPLGYTDGCQLYLPTSKMLNEGGYEIESYSGFGFPAPLAPGIENNIKEALDNFSKQDKKKTD